MFSSVTENIRGKMEGEKHKAIRIPEEPVSVGIIGSGSFGVALAKEFSRAGIDVVVGSRQQSKTFNGIQAVSVNQAIDKSNIIILAIPFMFIDCLPFNKITFDKIVIDCTNRTSVCRKTQLSQAELIEAKLPPGSKLVKALNTLSAYEIENRTRTIREIPIASNNRFAKDKITQMLHVLSYHAYDYGSLKAARQIENIPLQLFPAWQAPLLVSTLMWIFFYLLQFGRSYLCKDNKLGWFPTDVKDDQSISLLTNMFHKDIVKACDGQALNLLAACYLPGVLAAYIQLIRGTKYSVFPRWLNNWMLMRKHLGLLMLLSASIHALIYCLTKTFKEDLPWNEKAYITTGVLGFALAVILGITSLPSVSSTLSWREFRAIQSLLGWCCLMLTSLHAIFNALSPPKDGSNYKLFIWQDCYFGSTEQVALMLPTITFLLKIPLLLPWVDFRLTKIRQGVDYTLSTGWNGLRALGFEVKF